MSAEDLHAMGAHFVQVLCMMKHNGALEKAQAGFVALSERCVFSCCKVYGAAGCVAGVARPNTGM